MPNSMQSTSQPGPSGTAQPGPSDTAQPGPSGTAQPGPSDTAQPGPSGTAQPGPSDTAQPGPSGTAQPAMSTAHSPAAEIQPPEKENRPSFQIEYYQPPRLLPHIVKMMTKKNLPLLMCSEDDVYNPLLFKSIESYHRSTGNIFVVPPRIKLNVTYDSYHSRTVKWMVNVENSNSINKQSQFTAGILADVLNEDKRLEMILCIVANTPPTIFYHQKVLLDCRSEELKSDYPIPLHSKCILSKIKKTFNIGPKMFNTLTKDRSQNIIQRLSDRLYLSKRNVGNGGNLACYCNNITSKSSLLICEMCGEAQHKKCVVYDPKTEGGLPYLCSSCWTFNDPIQCRATLIIVPDNCLELWNQDIKRIVSPELKCFVYNGLQSCNFMQPTIFNKFDVVLISYSKLAKELKYGQYYVDENQITTGLRCYKKYPQSPLLCINWWRICLDQPQSYNSNIDKVLTIVLPLRAGIKWILPGTLIQDSSKDLFSIAKYLDLFGQQFDEMDFFRAVKETTEDWYMWSSIFVWSNLIKNINSELNLPIPIHEIHWLSFSEIENYFYKCTERFYTSYIKNNFRKNSALMNKLTDVDRNTKMDIVGTILVLLESCVVPLVRGKYNLKINGTFGLRHSLEERLDRCRAECNKLMRLIIGNLKNVTEFYTFISDISDYSFDTFVSQLMCLVNNFYKIPHETKMKYEVIEVIYKFYYLLKRNGSIKMRFPGDVFSFLENKMYKLESSIFETHLNMISRDQKMLQKKFAKTKNFTKEINSLTHNDWWIKILECVSSPSEFLTNVKTILGNNRKACTPYTVDQLNLTTLVDVSFNLTNWLNNTLITRNTIMSTYEKMKKISNWNNIVFGCTIEVCTLSNECIFCQFKHQIHDYKKLLMNGTIDNLDEDIIKNLVESKRQKTLSEYEILLRTLILCEKNNSVTDNYKIAKGRLGILNIVISEFLYMWKFWLSLDKYKSVCDQFNKAKCVPKFHEVLTKIKKPRHLLKRKNMNDNCIDPKSVEITKLFHQHLEILRGENTRYDEKIKILYKSFVYLRTLPNFSKSSTLYLCNACNAQINEHLLLYCGHCICNNCFKEETEYLFSTQLSCPSCNIYHSMKYMERIKEHHEFGVQLIGSYSIKIECIVSKLKEVIALNKCSKVIIFSSFKSSLDCLSSALSLNSINFMKLDLGCFNSTTVLNTFQNSENMTTILINLNIGLKNLKLNFATRVFFMEPIMDKSFENQIVDQICSKQIKQTYVHHFIIKDSIEEKISKTFTNDDQSLGMDLTLGQLANLVINETDLQTE